MNEDYRQPDVRPSIAKHTTSTALSYVRSEPLLAKFVDGMMGPDYYILRFPWGGLLTINEEGGNYYPDEEHWKNGETTAGYTTKQPNALPVKQQPSAQQARTAAGIERRYTAEEVAAWLAEYRGKFREQPMTAWIEHHRRQSRV